jgi:hypothetical protein
MQKVPRQRPPTLVNIAGIAFTAALFRFTIAIIDEPSVSRRLSEAVKSACARTLSREVWQ